MRLELAEPSAVIYASQIGVHGIVSTCTPLAVAINVMAAGSTE